MSFPILDNHIHLQPRGRNVEALRDFSRAGGTHVVLSQLPYDEVQIKEEEDFRASYQITLDIADKARKETDVRVFVSVGPYPVLLLSLAEDYGLARAIEIMKGGMDIAGELVEEGKAIALGEIGRPHFPVSSELLRASNDILSYGMKIASEIGCAVVLHTESATPESMREIAAIADSVSLDRGKVVKHYCPPLVLPEENHGLFPSVLASRTSISEALRKGSRFMMETDYLDDLSRPGAVMSITTVPKRTKALAASGSVSEEDILRIHKDNPEKVYDIAIE
ncbi:MAG: TatD family hydrolase [Methanomassiliicoccales archaeon]|nr:TatD family hydrolase [Methanomassiliicoccales archaeon]